MKHKLLSLLLALILLSGVLSGTGLTLPASAEGSEIAEITNILYRYEGEDLIFSCDGIPGARKYDFKIYQYDVEGGTIGAVGSQPPAVTVTEAQNEGRISWSYHWHNLYYQPGDGNMAPRFKIYIGALNKYGEVVAQCSTDFRSPFQRYLDQVRAGYLSNDGIFWFEPVPDAASYDIEMWYRATKLWTVCDAHYNFLNVLEDCREGDEYSFVVTAKPNDWYGQLVQSETEFNLTYSAENELSGTVTVNPDRSVSYGGFLGFLVQYTQTPIRQTWEHFDPDSERWQGTPLSQVGLYDASMLRVTVTAQGYPGQVVSANNTYTNPDYPYVATDFNGLYQVFNTPREDGKTVYIRLGADITASGYGRLEVLGGDVVLDLCGHTLSYTNNGSAAVFIWGENGTVTINDSRRYDSASGAWIDGRIEFLRNNPEEGYYGVLAGRIILNGGVIVNNNHNSGNCTFVGFVTSGSYPNGVLQMNGGVIDADYPVVLQGYSKDYSENLSAINGGTLRVRRLQGVTVHSSGQNDALPTFNNFKIVNASGNSQVRAFTISLRGGTTAAEAFQMFDDCFVSRSVACVDGERQSSVHSGITFIGDDYFYGPEFYETYEVQTLVALDDLNLGVTAPAQNGLPDYTVEGGDPEYYDTELEWLYQDRPGHFSPWDPDKLFRGGVTYRARITLVPKPYVGAFTLNPGKRVFINGQAAQQDYLTFTADFLPEDVYYDVWLGSVRVSRGNRGDVLGDGGSVQFFEPGEYTPLEINSVYGTEFIRNYPVLVLDNFTMSKVLDDYHAEGPNRGQLYIGQDLAIVLKGENTFYRYGSASGISVAKGCWVSFHGTGSLTVDKMNDRNALEGYNVELWVREEASLTLNGSRGVFLMNDGGVSTVNLTDQASLTCNSYHNNTTGSDYPALNTYELKVTEDASLVCKAFEGPALSTRGVVFPNNYYDVRVLGLQEYEYPVDGNPATTPYAPANGLNGVGGLSETQCRYVSLRPKRVYASGISLDRDTYYLNPSGIKETVNVYFWPTEAAAFYDQVTWTNSDPAAVQVIPDPYNPRKAALIGLKDGTATVTATAPGGATAECTVQVQGFINPFTDVKANKYYYTAVLWAYYHFPQIASGTSDNTFSPNATCTREQIVTYLWHALGNPEPVSTDNPFTDVKKKHYFYQAVLWAVENGVTSGVDATTFGVGQPCTRAQAMTFLWNALGKPEPKSTDNPFTDVKQKQYYYKAVLWAVENGITSGVGNGKFGVNDTCTRAQIVTFLFTAMVKLN